MHNRTVNGIPQLGLGTFGRTGDDGLRALLDAIEIGYRHIDTAQSYGTEENVGKAVERSGLPRDAFFITTKVADTNLARRDFLPSVEKSLETLALDRIDLLLIHWPSARDAVPFADYMEALAETRARGWAARRACGRATQAGGRLRHAMAKGDIGELEAAIAEAEAAPKMTAAAAARVPYDGAEASVLESCVASADGEVEVEECFVQYG